MFMCFSCDAEAEQWLQQKSTAAPTRHYFGNNQNPSHHFNFFSYFLIFLNDPMENLIRWKPQDELTVLPKASKRSPLVLRTVVLLFAISCGLYIFSICIKQTDIFRQTYNNPAARSIRVSSDRPQNRPNCRNNSIHDDPYVHFPNPETFGRQECACNPVRYFVIVSMQRSGSGWFETLLNSHMNLSSNGEMLGQQDRRNNVSVIYQNLDKIYNLDMFTSASKNECSAAVGFKWMLNQGLMKYHEEISEYFKQRGVSIIFMFRRNVLRRMISLLANAYDKQAKLLNGTHKSHVHSAHEAEVLASYKPTLNVTVLKSQLRSAEGMMAKALECFKTTRHIVLYYEDIIANHTKLVDVQEFLKLPRRNLTSFQVKIHSGPLSKQIANWDDVQKTLQGTPYESYINTD